MPERPMPTPADRARLLSHSIRMPNGCREWQARKDREGYGLTSIKRRTRSAHVVAYESVRGPVPEGLVLEGLVLDHVICDNPSCCDEWHVEPTTQRENVLRSLTSLTAIHARKTHCIHGHEFTLENTYLTRRPPSGLWRRSCRTCRADIARRAYRRKRNPAPPTENT